MHVSINCMVHIFHYIGRKNNAEYFSFRSGEMQVYIVLVNRARMNLSGQGGSDVDLMTSDLHH